MACGIDKCKNNGFYKDEKRCDCLTNKPDIYCNKTCKVDEGYYLDTNCSCKRSPMSLLPPNTQCPIDQCSIGHVLDPKTCICKQKHGAICLIGCPKGQNVFAGEGCICRDDPKCPIKNCKNGIYFDNVSCKCIVPTDPQPKPVITCRKRCKYGYELVSPCKCVPMAPPKPGIICRRFCHSGYKLVAPCTCVPIVPKPVIKCKRRCGNGYELVSPCKCMPKMFPKPVITCKKRCGYGYELVSPCSCVPKRFPKPFKCIKLCQPGYKLISPCSCVLNNPFMAANCYINECQNNFQLNPTKCKCEEVKTMLPTCMLGCPTGFKVYPGGCSCEPIPTCAIKNCKNSNYVDEETCTCPLVYDW